MEAQVPPHGTNYSKRSKDGSRLQTRQRIIIWHVRLATREQPNGSSRTIPSSNGSLQVHSCGFMGNVCPYFLPFSRPTEDIPSSQRDPARAYSGPLFLRHSYPLEIDIATQLCDHRGHQYREQSGVGLYGLFLLRFQGQL